MARFYTTQFLFANVFVLLFAHAMRTGHRGLFAIADAAAVLGFISHFTTMLIVGGCFAVLALAWIARVPPPHLGTGFAALMARERSVRLRPPAIPTRPRATSRTAEGSGTCVVLTVKNPKLSL
jgi:hypothetical protein